MTTDRPVAIVTGGTRGIGRAVSESLAGDGWRVALAYRSDEAAARDAADAVRGAGGEPRLCRGDVSDPDARERLVSGTVAAWGRIDALVNAAGPYQRVPLLECSLDEWRATFDANLHAVFDLARRVAGPMRERRFGRIVNFAMSNAERLVGQTELTAYYVAKVGVLVLTRSLAKALAADGITVNAVSPGYVDTGGHAEELARMLPRIPAGRLGTPDDAVAVVRFFLSAEAGYVSGANIPVSGAWGV